MGETFIISSPILIYSTPCHSDQLPERGVSRDIEVSYKPIVEFNVVSGYSKELLKYPPID
jgi:hypothetical protein